MKKNKNWEELRKNNNFRIAVYNFIEPITKTILERLKPFQIPFVEKAVFLQEEEPICNVGLYLEVINPNTKIPRTIRNEVEKIISQVLEDNNVAVYYVTVTGKTVMWSIHNIDKIVA